MVAKLNYFIVGAPKCGTTSLFYYLCQHPNVYDPGLKEPHFLCEEFPRLRVIHNDADYAQLFAGATDEHRAVGEASMTYVYSDIALRRIREINPDARILMILRNPLDMLASWHSHSLASLNEDEPDFAKAWALQEQRAAGKQLPPKCLEPFFLQYRQMGMLGTYVQKLYGQFPRDNIKLLFSEDLRHKTSDVYDDLLDFLGLAPFADANFVEMNANRATRIKWLARITERPVGQRYANKLVGIKKLLGMEDTSLRQRLRRWNQPRLRREPLAPEFKQMLIETFSDDVQLLAELSGRNLDHWLK